MSDSVLLRDITGWVKGWAREVYETRDMFYLRTAGKN